MSKLYPAEVLVIRARDFGEADKILTLYTREQGKVQAVAKGVRKPKSKLRGGVQLFSHTRVLLYRGPNLDTVTQSENIQAFAGIRDNLELISYASYLAELLDAAVPEREPHEGIFRLAVTAFGLLLGGDPEPAARYFEMHLLSLLGYRPHLSGCITCGHSLEDGDFFLDPEAGGLVCARCVRGGKAKITAGTAMTLSRFLTLDPALLSRVKIPAGMRREMDVALGKYLEYYLERKLKSRGVLKELLAGSSDLA